MMKKKSPEFTHVLFYPTTRDLIRFNVVSAVPQELQNLYRLMEVEFDPLNLCTRMQNNIEWIQEHPELG